MKLNELANPSDRAGFLPYVMVDGEPLFYFMIPSKENFGGLMPQVAKGRVDKGENVFDAALREAREELGLKRSNLKPETIKLAWRGKLRGKTETYEMTVYTGELKDKRDFKQPHHETGERRWLTASQFSKEGAEQQIKIVNAAKKLISQFSTK